MKSNKFDYTNVYVPNSKQRFQFQDISSNNIDNELMPQVSSTHQEENEVPYGIIDFAKQSSEYKSLIISLKIDNYSNFEIHEMILLKLTKTWIKLFIDNRTKD